MRTTHRLLMRGLAVAMLASGALAADAHPSVGVSIGVGFPAYGAVVPTLPYGAVSIGYGVGYRYPGYWNHAGVWYRPWGARWVVVAPPVGYVTGSPYLIDGVSPPMIPGPAQAPAPAPSAAPSSHDPVIYPRNGQSADQTESDRQGCNRWATTQPQAVADAGAFQRAVEACMDGRGYSMR